MNADSSTKNRFHCVPNLLLLLVVCLSAFPRSVRAQWDLSRMRSGHGDHVRYHARPIPDELRNAWPSDLEDEFQQRAARILKKQVAQQKPTVNTFFENEKRSYGFLMAHVLAGQSETALAMLQQPDHQHELWHRETHGIDFFACFTLKHQIRKYFYFGDLLEAEYRARMLAGAKAWTKQDPLRRPHYAYDGSPGWGPNAKNSWVDVRSTENLFLMRVTSVYLMAEASGNAFTAEKYKSHILNYARTLLRIGIGEWDSENYHGHSITPLLNLYDFAKDIEVQRAAKACLDFYAIAGSVKYWRGGFSGPSKRDYNHPQPFGGSAANALWVWFGDHPTGKQDHWESDEVHQITSAYRPPLAAVHLAHKRFDKPVELFSAKPEYSATTSFRAESPAAYLETTYIANSYLMGSLTGGTSRDGGDVNGFKILAWDETDGAIALHAAPTSNPRFPGSPMYQTGIVSAENRIAQMANMAIWLCNSNASPWLWVIPEDVLVETVDNTTILKCDRTWIAIHSLNAGPLELNEGSTQTIREGKKAKFPKHKVLQTQGLGTSPFCGFAIEIGEAESHQNYHEFRRAVLAAHVDTSLLDAGIVHYQASDGQQLGLEWNNNPLHLGILRNSQQRDLQAAARILYGSRILNSKRGSGFLELNTGGAHFQLDLETLEFNIPQ